MQHCCDSWHGMAWHGMACCAHSMRTSPSEVITSTPFGCSVAHSLASAGMGPSFVTHHSSTAIPVVQHRLSDSMVEDSSTHSLR